MKRKPWQGAERATSFGGLTRGALMSRIRSHKNGTTELRLISLMRSSRLAGWRRGYPLLGKPDFVWPKAKVAVFVDGCFWHGHGCGRNLTPKTNAALWQKKIAANRARDIRVARDLRAKGWRVFRIWECTLRKSPEMILRKLMKAVLSSTEPSRGDTRSGNDAASTHLPSRVAKSAENMVHVGQNQLIEMSGAISLTTRRRL